MIIGAITVSGVSVVVYKIIMQCATKYGWYNECDEPSEKRCRFPFGSPEAAVDDAKTIIGGSDV